VLPGNKIAIVSVTDYQAAHQASLDEVKNDVRNKASQDKLQDIVGKKAAELASKTHAYPLEEINDYLHLHPARAEAVRDAIVQTRPGTQVVLFGLKICAREHLARIEMSSQKRCSLIGTHAGKLSNP